MESFLEFLTTELAQHLLNWLLLGIFVVVAFIVRYVANALANNEFSKQYLNNLSLVRELALSFVVSAAQLTEDDLSYYEGILDERGITNLDPRMAYVLIKLEHAIEARSIVEFDILELRDIAEQIYQRWSHTGE